MARLSPVFPRAWDANGDPVPGGELHVYYARSVSEAEVFSDAALSVAMANPQIADANGIFAEMYVPSGEYKIVVKDADGATLYSADNLVVQGGDAVYFDSIADAEAGFAGSAEYLWIGDLQYRASASDVVITTADGATFSPAGLVRPEHWGAVADGATDVTDEVASAVAFGNGACWLLGAAYYVTNRFRLYEFHGPGLLLLNGTVDLPKGRPSPGRLVRMQHFPPYYDSLNINDAVPVDFTGPRNDEGIEVRADSYELVSPGNRVSVQFEALAWSEFADKITAWVNIDDETTARFAAVHSVGDEDYAPVTLRGTIHPEDGVSARTFTFRMGATDAYINGDDQGARLNETISADVTVIETEGELLEWGGGQSSDYRYGDPLDGLVETALPLVGSRTVYNVSTPSGDPPAEGDPESHRYRHHTVCGIHNGKIWVAHSSSGTSEDESGQQTVAAYASTGVGTFSSLMVAVPSQSTFTATGTGQEAGPYKVSYPRCMIAASDGKFYLVSGIDERASGVIGEGLALVACELKDDGTLGTLYRISDKSYAGVSYDATLAGLLYEKAKLYGPYGGSMVGNGDAASDWLQFKLRGEDRFSEPATIDMRGDETLMVRLWRRNTSLNRFMGIEHSYDGGKSWSGIRDCAIPCPPSSAHGIRLSDGRIALAHNLQNRRDPLCLSIFDPNTGVREETVRAIEQNVSPSTPVYAGTNKGSNAAAYPCMVQDGTDLWCSFSVNKERIDVVKFAIPS